MRLSQISLAITRLGGQDADAALRKALWPLGTEPGLWIDPPYTPASYQDSTGTTPMQPVGTVADQPVGLQLDRKWGEAMAAPILTSTFTGTGNLDGWTKEATAINNNGVNQLDLTSGPGSNVGAFRTLTTVVGTTYLLELDLISTSSSYFRVDVGPTPITPINAPGKYRIVFTADNVSTVASLIVGGSASTSSVVDNISVREIPGLHLSQATSAAMPFASGRVNLLAKTEDLSWPSWVTTNGANFMGGIADPSGDTKAFRFTAGSAGATVRESTGVSVPVGSAISAYVRRSTGTGTVSFWDGVAYSAISLTAAWSRVTIAQTALATGYFGIQITTAGDAVEVWHPQVEFSPVATAYQRVNDDSDYTAAGLPIYDKFDGVDAALLSATVAAGVVGNSNMELLMAVRINETTVDDAIVATIGGPNYAWATGGLGFINSGVGTPTYYVNNVGVAATRPDVDAAVGVGKWAILEIRGLNLSAWTNIAIQGWSPYFLAMDLGGIMIFPAASAADRNKARTRLAAKVGLVL